MSILVWFQLADSTGKHYKNTRAVKASIFSSADVDDFLKAVKVEFPNILSSYDCGELFVYKDKAALDANEIFDEKFDSTIGQSKKDALIVVVPSLPGAQLKQQVRFNFEQDVGCCKLSTNFLNEFRLQSYITAAAICAVNKNFIDLLNQLEGYDVPEKKPCTFTCIVASSGTGKTQLAATAAASERNVVYFYTGMSGDGSGQAFYAPHIELRNTLFKLLLEFRKSEMIIESSAIIGADHIYGEYLQRADPLFAFLYKCFFGISPPGEVTLEDLRGRVLQEEKKLLVFLDEVPQETSGNFLSVMVLRNILRTVAVDPILMSTHTGSINAIGRGTDSRDVEISPKWCRVIVDFPGYQADDVVFSTNPWLLRSERPLVAKMMVELEEKRSITVIVDEIQKMLQVMKPTAWQDTPGLQLCQIFHSKIDNVTPGFKQRIVGHHFGRLVMPKSPCEITRHHAIRWIDKQLVEFVDPTKEPILFLALTTWKKAQIKIGSEQFFPLIDDTNLQERRRKLSIRGAFNEVSSYFTIAFDTSNYEAKKLEGNTLEVLALASISLASLQSDEGVFQYIKLPHLLTCVFHLMCPQDLDASRLDETEKEIKRLLLNSSFSSLTVPTSVYAPFSQMWADHNIPPFVSGQIKRPADAERRDGVVQCGKEEVLHVECKNYKDGFTTQAAKDVVKRIVKQKSKVTILFISHLTNIFTSPGGWCNLTKELKIHKHSISFLVLQLGKIPTWLTIQNGAIPLDVQGETERLAVIVATGKVEAIPNTKLQHTNRIMQL